MSNARNKRAASHSRYCAAARGAGTLASACSVLIALLLGTERAFGADCNGNGIADDVDIASGASRDCDADGMPDECESLPLLIGSVAHATLAGAAGMMAIGDLDGNGTPDIAVATLEPGSLGVTVFLDPASGGAGIANTLASVPVDLDCGDLDGDGDRDLAVARDGAIRTFFNAGDGTFPTRGYVAQTGSFTAMRIGDFDKDGVNDVVASVGDRGAVAVFRGVGEGAFAPPVETAVASPGVLALVDADGDGALDVLVLESQGRLALLRNSGGVSLAAPASITAAGSGLVSFAARDVDGDGLPDLAVIGASMLRVLFNRGGSFELASTFTLSDGATLRSVAIGDADGDNVREIVVGRTSSATVGELALIRAFPDGRLEPTQPVEVASTPGSIALVDLDGDGTDELVVPAAGAHEVTIFRRRLDSPAPPMSVSFRTATHSIQDFGNFEPHMSFLADLAGDGRLDLATMDGEDRLMILRNQGDGTYGDETIYNVRDAEELIAIAPADLDGDGDLDITAVDERTNYLLVLLNDGDGTFTQTAKSHETGARPYFVAAADLDGDGDLDVVTANEQAAAIGVFRNRGNADFDAEESIEVGQGPAGIVAADFDGDGDPDIAVGQTGAAQVTVFSNDGHGNLADPVEYAAGRVSYLSGADFDNDGDLDLVAARESEKLLTVLRNDGGAFQAMPVIELGQPPRSVIAPDVNGDGLPDLAAANEDTNTISLLENIGDGQFGAPSHFTVGRAPRFATSGDIDRDGDVDLVVANHSSYDFWYFFNERQAQAPAASPLERICTELRYSQLARQVAADACAELEVMYLAPASAGDPGLLPTVFFPTAASRRPWQMLAEFFPERFGGLTEEAYLDLVARRATRQYFAGSVLLLRRAGSMIFGFTVQTDGATYAGERITESEAAQVYGALDAAFLLEPFAYYPDTPGARVDARAWGATSFPLALWVPPIPFLRGDAQTDGVVDIADAVSVLQYLFGGGAFVPCADAADANDDGRLDLSDAVKTLLHLFGGAGPLPAPSEACGIDPTEDQLDCLSYTPCGA